MRLCCAFGAPSAPTVARLRRAVDSVKGDLRHSAFGAPAAPTLARLRRAVDRAREMLSDYSRNTVAGNFTLGSGLAPRRLGSASLAFDPGIAGRAQAPRGGQLSTAVVHLLAREVVKPLLACAVACAVRRLRLERQAGAVVQLPLAPLVVDLPVPG